MEKGFEICYTISSLKEKIMLNNKLGITLKDGILDGKFGEKNS